MENEFNLFSNFFPGQRIAPGTDIASIQNYIKKQKRVKGFTCVTTPAGTTTNLNLSGDAKIFLGLSLIIDGLNVFSLAAYNTIFSFKINNETIIDQINGGFIMDKLTVEEYCFYPRPLNGTDNINCTIIDPTSANWYLTLYYI